MRRLKIRVHTVAGLQCKARLLYRHDCQHQELSDSIIADLLTMQETAWQKRPRGKAGKGGFGRPFFVAMS